MQFHKGNPRYQPMVVPRIRDSYRTAWTDRWNREFAPRWQVKGQRYYPIGELVIERRSPTYAGGK